MASTPPRRLLERENFRLRYYVSCRSSLAHVEAGRPPAESRIIGGLMNTRALM
jgi:hypothetical protein